jgi:hypothetical protein
MARAPTRWILACCLLLAGVGLWLAPPVQAGTPRAASAAVAPLLAEWQWWKDFKKWFSQQASNRARIVQFGCIGMVIALLILYSASKRRG